MADQDQLETKAGRAFVCGHVMDAAACRSRRRRSQAWTRPLDAENGRPWTSSGRRCEIAGQAMDAGDGRPWTVGMDAPHSLRGVHPSRGGQPVLSMTGRQIQHSTKPKGYAA